MDKIRRTKSSFFTKKQLSNTKKFSFPPLPTTKRIFLVKKEETFIMLKFPFYFIIRNADCLNIFPMLVGLFFILNSFFSSKTALIYFFDKQCACELLKWLLFLLLSILLHSVIKNKVKILRDIILISFANNYFFKKNFYWLWFFTASNKIMGHVTPIFFRFTNRRTIGKGIWKSVNFIFTVGEN